MKNRSICLSLGVSQQELAQLLNVSRSLISLYELGLRELPTPASHLLTEMMLHLNTSKTNVFKSQATHQGAHIFQRMLKENEFQQALAQRKIDEVNKKLEQQARLARLDEFLNTRANQNSKTKLDSKMLSPKMSSSLIETTQLDLLKLQHKLEVLIYEQTLLNSKLKNLALENKNNHL